MVNWIAELVQFLKLLYLCTDVLTLNGCNQPSCSGTKKSLMKSRVQAGMSKLFLFMCIAW